MGGVLPVKAKIGGKKGGGLSLKTDMSGLGTKKVNSPKAGSLGTMGSMPKNPGKKMRGKKA